MMKLVSQSEASLPPSPKKKKRETHRPGQRPSKERLLAQKKISIRNEKIRRKEITLPKVKTVVADKPQTKDPPASTSQDAASDNDSDKTICYDPPKDTRRDRKHRKTVAKFVF